LRSGLTFFESSKVIVHAFVLIGGEPPLGDTLLGLLGREGDEGANGRVEKFLVGLASPLDLLLDRWQFLWMIGKVIATLLEQFDQLTVAVGDFDCGDLKFVLREGESWLQVFQVLSDEFFDDLVHVSWRLAICLSFFVLFLELVKPLLGQIEPDSIIASRARLHVPLLELDVGLAFLVVEQLNVEHTNHHADEDRRHGDVLRFGRSCTVLLALSLNVDLRIVTARALGRPFRLGLQPVHQVERTGILVLALGFEQLHKIRLKHCSAICVIRQILWIAAEGVTDFIVFEVS
jgi:hypothetical protein